jgi:drug/metabolite transporter (DMT)-like permease
MLLGSFAFAVMGALAHASAATCSWQVIALARAALPLALMVGFALPAGTRLVLWRPGTLWIRSIAGSLSMIGTFFALTRLPVADVFTLTNLFPLWMAVLAWPVLAEPPSGPVWLSVASGVLGVVLIQQPHFATGNYATLIALACSVLTAIAMLGLHHLQGLDPRAIVVHFSGVALLFCVATFFLFERAAVLLDGPAFLLLLGLGVAATVGQLGLTKAFTAGPPTKVAVVGLSQVVFALLFDTLFWQRSLNPLTLAGMGLVLAPTAWVLTRRGT